MKFCVFMWAILVMFSSATSDKNSDPETYNLIESTNLAKPGCENRCGNLIVPYPFGIGEDSNCYINDGFRIYCNTSSNLRKAYIITRYTFTERNYTPIRLISDSTVRISNSVDSRCYFPNGTISQSTFRFYFYLGGPYTFSQVNKFTVVGCNNYAWLTSRRNYSTYSSNNYSTYSSRNYSTYLSTSGCGVYCSEQVEVPGGECTGNGCCRSRIPRDIFNYRTWFTTMLDSSNVKMSFHPCTYAFIGEESAFNFNGVDDLNDARFVKRIEETVPVVLEWAIGHLTCGEANVTSDYACQSNTRCVDSNQKTRGYRCICKQGYEGSPYLSPGCQDINECNDKKKFPCYGICTNTIGSYTCKCKSGYSGDARVQDGCQRKAHTVLRLSLGIGLGFLTLLIGLPYIVHLMFQNRKLYQRAKFYEQNGGVLLEDKLKTGVSFMIVFKVKDLEKATSKFAEDNVVGRGGNGTVYKGTLQDERVVAIKKSRKVNPGQREAFTSEMIILTQIKHQNVVQLLGCCLETDVPLLVYEFVSNDTLYYHIHKNKSGNGILTWDSRLRIAHESASALAYLHKADAKTSIVHRDVKSTNILLDDDYTAKIADFGSSRFVSLGHDEVTTLVQGTIGYLDPEFFHTSQLTDKSDVYSFGVVLAELLTGKQTIDEERGEEDCNLATYFVRAKKKNQLLDILDHQVVKEATDKQIKAISKLVCRCLKQVGKKRPSMEEVADELETLRKLGKQHLWDISQEVNTETSRLIVESGDHGIDIVPSVANSDSFGECSSSSATTKEIMLQVQNPR